MSLYFTKVVFRLFVNITLFHKCRFQNYSRLPLRTKNLIPNGSREQMMTIINFPVFRIRNYFFQIRILPFIQHYFPIYCSVLPVLNTIFHYERVTYVYIRIFTYVFLWYSIYTYTHTHIYICVCVCIYIYIYIYPYLQNVYMCTSIHNMRGFYGSVVYPCELPTVNKFFCSGISKREEPGFRSRTLKLTRC